MKPKNHSRNLFSSSTARSVIMVACLSSPLAQAAPLSWNGATAGVWGLNTNWSPAAVPTSTDDLTILGPLNVAGVLNINVAAASAAGSISVTDTAAVTLTNTTSGANQTLSVANGITTSTGAVTIGSATANQNVNVALGASQTWNVGSGGMTLPNIVSGSGFALTKSGFGTLTLTGANTFNGGTTISSGILATNKDPGAANAGVFIDSGATLSLTVAGTLTSTVTGAGAILSTGVSLTGNLSGFGGSFTHNSTTASSVFNSATASSKDASYVLNSVQGGSQGFVVGFTGTNTFELGSLAGVAGSLFRGGNTATGTSTLQIGNLGTSTTFAGSINNGTTKVLALTKVGGGTLTLSGVSTYNAATAITGGTLALTGAGTINATTGITVNGSDAKYLHTSSVASTRAITLTQGTLDGTGTVGAVTVGNGTGAILTHGNGGTGVLTVGSLAFGGAATVNATLTGGAAPINVTGALSTTPANGTVTLNIASSPLGNGLHNIISAGSFGGAASNFTLNLTSGVSSRQSAILALNGTNVAIQVSGDAPKWTGARNDGQWTETVLGAPKNWKLITGGTTTDFVANDNVLFDDTATGTTAVDISESDIVAGTIEFNNSTKNYTVSSPNGYAIAAGTLTKNGTGSLTLSTPNYFTGGSTFNGGTLNLNSLSPLGTGTFTVGTGSAKTLNNTSGDAIITSSSGAQNWNDDFTFTGSSDLDLGSGAVTVAGGGTDRAITVSAGIFAVGEIKAAAHGLIKQGAGTLAITSSGAGAAASTLSGSLNVAAGTLQINRTGSAGTGSGDFTATGLAGAGTITNGANDERWLFINSAVATTFTGTLANGGTGGLGFNKQGTGSMTLAGTNSYTGTTTLGGGGTLIVPVTNTGAGTNVNVDSGTLVMGHPSAFGTAATIRLAGNALSTLDIATDGGDNVYGFLFGTTTNSTVISNRATPGAGINHTLTTITANGVGGGTLTVTSGTNVTSGTGRISFTEFGMSAGSVQTTILNPTGANLTLGAVSKVANAPAQTLELGGISQDNLITGVIANGTAPTVSLIKSNSSIWTISNTNTYTGNTQIGTLNAAGILRATASGALGAGSILFDGSGGAPGPTSRLELSGGITLGNAISLNHRNNTSAVIESTAGNNILSGAIDLQVGGTQATVQSDAGLLTLSGPISTTVAAARNLHLAGAGNGLASGNIFDNSLSVLGVVNITKDGAGTWSLTGANTYTGTTTVTGGKLAVNGSAIPNAGKLVIDGGQVEPTGTEVVGTLYFGAVQQAAGTWGASGSGATNIDNTRFSGSGVVSVTTGAAGGYTTWAAANAGGQASNLDFDNDGVKNGVEYFMGATGSTFTANPSIAGGKVVWPKDPAFAGTYTVQTSPDLAIWTNVTSTVVGNTVEYTVPTGQGKLFVRLDVVPN